MDVLIQDATRPGAYEIPAAALAQWLHATQQEQTVRDPDLPDHRGTICWAWLRQRVATVAGDGHEG